MRILLDTHTFMWWAEEPQQLSSIAAALCDDAENILLLSVASLWEMQIKIGTGKLQMLQPLREVVATQVRDNGLQLLPIELRHLWALETLPLHHKDPFDRLLIAQARIEAVPLLSRDELVTQYDIKVLL